MGILSSLFSSGSATKIIDEAISGIDKMVYTEEEKAEAKKEMVSLKVNLLNAYAPFKLTQRYLALVFASLYSFLLLLIITLTAMKYTEQVKQILEIIEIFGLNWIMLAIISFYYSAGLVESFRRKG